MRRVRGRLARLRFGVLESKWHALFSQRQHLSGVLLTFRQMLAAEFASRNWAYTAAVPATE